MNFFSEIKENDDELSCLVRECGNRKIILSWDRGEAREGTTQGRCPEGHCWMTYQHQLEGFNISNSQSHSSKNLYLQIQN